MADRFVRVRQPAIDNADIGLFDFDFDLTMMVFFLNADEQIYGRYCGRVGQDADARQSLAGLHHAMQAALKAHGSEEQRIAPRRTEKRQAVRDLRGGNRRGCVHCHQVRELLNAELKRTGKWSEALIYRFPPPDNLGFVLEVDRGNVVKNVKTDSPASVAGLQAGDVIEQVRNVPVHSLADAQYALDQAPLTGEISIAWRRGKETTHGALTLPAGWRKTDISWRRSMDWIIPSARVFGRNLNADERREHGLGEKQLAFRQGYPVSKAAAAAGVREGDIILGFDGQKLEMTAYEFLAHVRANYLSGDRVTIDLLRDGQKMRLPMKLP